MNSRRNSLPKISPMNSCLFIHQNEFKLLLRVKTILNIKAWHIQSDVQLISFDKKVCSIRNNKKMTLDVELQYSVLPRVTFATWHAWQLYLSNNISETDMIQARRRGGGGGFEDSNEPPLELNNGGLKTQTVDFQLLANSGGMENKLWVLQLLIYPARKRYKYRESIKLLGEWVQVKYMKFRV